ncbi:unnamed protein product, partial [Rotaria sp. Silwood2]
KTTVLNVAKFGKNVVANPTIGPDFVKIEVNNASLLIMEEGGRSRTRASRRIYYRGVSGLIFVLDATDRERINEVRDELLQLSKEEEFQNKPILIFANKQDLSNPMSSDEIQEKISLTTFNENVKWHLQPACAIQNEGLREGFQWLENSMAKKVDTITPVKETIDDLSTIKHRLMSLWNMGNFKTLWSKFF